MARLSAGTPPEADWSVATATSRVAPSWFFVPDPVVPARFLTVVRTARRLTGVGARTATPARAAMPGPGPWL
ncbi:hypothetical protein [Streptomyces soliscabiei]|uniref:hypothetical protein n=1 Tax=Streptomyces soliscabiei TaxID=588897 RepID=UPI0029B26EC3|nr:hypothetical protein [Streptomyces sp. NY05-11A]MDX2679857.1 hypothetical protein [Streptomyces sp. NY05-11A]